ncbi:F-box domain-containing protein [Pleurostoma richardsiae]|uniref:F-box domain-containing protein n=1 Tax=Pleurostoma richardsiae TaxID=41990 RepID=A0AA38RQZ0_9PEZI|nr:F-box domain-containing protein [Pleurostoma richardsiae]
MIFEELEGMGPSLVASIRRWLWKPKYYTRGLLILERIEGLLSVTWRSVPGSPCWMPNRYLGFLRCRPQTVKLYVEGLPLRDVRSSPCFPDEIPAGVLVSLKMREPLAIEPNLLPMIQELLLKAERLENFHYEDRGRGRQFTFGPDDRLPPFRELKLRCYGWHHDRNQVLAHWDFSRIRSLELLSVPIYNFLSSVSFATLADLHTFCVEDAYAYVPDEQQRTGTRGLYNLVKHHIRALTTLQITGCHTQLFPIDAILVHGNTLETLRFRDAIGFEDDWRHCPTLPVDDVLTLADHLPFLHTLELDMDITSYEASMFLKALCTFRRLHTLTLHVQTLLWPIRELGNAPASEDPDRDAAMAIFQFLLESKDTWRRLTLKVGGWRRIGVRRLSAAWRQMNAQGRYAERCFVMERAGEDGRMEVREEEMITEPEGVRNGVAGTGVGAA